jgi:hypothetical protein
LIGIDPGSDCFYTGLLTGESFSVENNIDPLEYLYQKPSAEDETDRKGLEDPDDPDGPEIEFHECVGQQFFDFIGREL